MVNSQKDPLSVHVRLTEHGVRLSQPGQFCIKMKILQQEMKILLLKKADFWGDQTTPNIHWLGVRPSEFSIKNEESFSRNEELLSENDEFCVQYDGSWSRSDLEKYSIPDQVRFQ